VWPAAAAVGALPAVGVTGWWIVPLAAVLYLACDLLHQLAHLGAALAAGVPRAKMRLRRDLRASFSEDVTTRQSVVTWASGPVFTLLAGCAALALRHPVGYVLASCNALVLASTLQVCDDTHTDARELLAHYATWRESRRLLPLTRAVAALEGPDRFGRSVALAMPYVRRDPHNFTLMLYVAQRLVMDLRPVEAAGLVRRYAAQYGIRPAARAKARLAWATIVLTYADLMPEHVEEACRTAGADTGDRFHSRYLRALAALRRRDAQAALSGAEHALERWRSGAETVSKHAVGCAYGVRALALLALGRTAEAEAAARAGEEHDAGCFLSDVLDEARAALTGSAA
jgi:hypothetical protein